ncbi:MAG: hypothetical protein JXI33_07070 [Candidatus Aminicenantes bacterium]|nr:hypothetical protein [Candidatus Aminicenantes bacterium]
MWLVFISVSFFIVQFFSERKYPIGFINPPTPVFFISFTILVVSVVIYANYDYYHDFFGSAAKNNFIKILLLNFLILILGIIFIFLRSRRKKWLQVFFVLLMCFDLWAGHALLMKKNQLSPSAFKLTAPVISPPRQINLVVMEGLSMNYLLSVSQEQKLLNFAWIKENGVMGRLKTFKPNPELAFFNTLLTGDSPADFVMHSDYKYQFSHALLEFDIYPRYIFFRNSSRLAVTNFYKKASGGNLDHLRDLYQENGFKTFSMIDPPVWPVFAENNLKKNYNFVQFFSPSLGQKDSRLTILKKTFFYDDFIRNQIPELKSRNYRYSLVLLPGLEMVNSFFYHYARPENFGNLIPPGNREKYGWILDKYYEYYDAVLGKIIGSMGDNELLMVLSFYEMEPMPMWRRILVKNIGRRDVFVYKSMNELGTVLLYEKSALKKGLFHDSIALADAYPTLLYYAGFPLYKGLKGEVIKDIFSDAFLAENPVYFTTD